jgi:hypothetical protein
MSTDESPALLLPDDFDDYAWEIEAKGYFGDVGVRLGDRIVNVTFYDPVRLQQEIESDLLAGRAFAVERLRVVSKVTRENMQAAIANLGHEQSRNGETNVP